MFHTSPRKEERKVDQEQPLGRVSKFIRDLVPDWRPSSDQWLWAIRIVLVLAVLLGTLTLIGLPFDITLWNWLDLLIVPVVLALGGYLFTRTENQRTRQSANDQKDLDRELANQQTESDRYIADQRRQDVTLQAYLDQIGQLLLDKDRPLRQSKEGDEVRTLARARTVTILRRLDSARNRDILQFLREARLTPSPEQNGLGGSTDAVIRLDYTNLSKAELRGANLDSFDLQETNLSDADLRDAYLAWSFLHKTVLRGANLRGATLGGDSDLSGHTDLSYADLRSTILKDANLSNADLSNADLSNAKVTSEQLAEAKSLKGATRPDGSIHP
jgi:hypothetical protein